MIQLNTANTITPRVRYLHLRQVSSSLVINTISGFLIPCKVAIPSFLSPIKSPFGKYFRNVLFILTFHKFDKVLFYLFNRNPTLHLLNYTTTRVKDLIYEGVKGYKDSPFLACNNCYSCFFVRLCVHLLSSTHLKESLW